MHSVDIHVGKRLRHQRCVQGVTQGELAEALGIRFQQVQKYESGNNRVSASRLWDIAKVLNVPVSYFFEGLDPPLSEEPPEGGGVIRFYRSAPVGGRGRSGETLGQGKLPAAVSS